MKDNDVSPLVVISMLGFISGILLAIAWKLP